MLQDKSAQHHLPFVLSLLVLFLFVACSSSPSESEGRKFLEEKGAEKKLYKIRSFTKTNGVDGDRTYRMEFKMEIECLQPGAVAIGDSGGGVLLIKCPSTGQVGNVEGPGIRKNRQWLAS